MQRMKIKLTYSQSEPYKSGWKGWADWIDVFLDGVQIGILYAEGQDHRRHMEYTFDDRLSSVISANIQHSGYKLNVAEYGLKAAKDKLRRELEQFIIDREALNNGPQDRN